MKIFTYDIAFHDCMLLLLSIYLLAYVCTDFQNPQNTIQYTLTSQYKVLKLIKTQRNIRRSYGILVCCMIPLQYLSQFHLFESLWVWNHHHMILCKLTRRQMISFRVLKVFLEFMILKQIIKRYGSSFMSSNWRYFLQLRLFFPWIM